MVEEAHHSPALDTDPKKAAEWTVVAEDIESRITTAMRSRVGHFKEQADSLTFKGVRRLLEEDFGLETFALDVHKRMIKQCLLKCLDGGNDDEGSKSSGESLEKKVSTTTKGTESLQGRQPKKDRKEACSEDEKLGDCPVLDLLTGHKTTTENGKTEKKDNKEVSESTIQKAIRQRASYIEANSEKVTMAGLRRLLEEDLKLDKYTLDAYKKFITEKLDEVLKSCEVSAPGSEVKKTDLKKNAQSKSSNGASRKVNSASSGSESDEKEEEEDEEEDEDEEEEEEEVKPKKRITAKGKIKNSEGLRKRKIPKKEAKMQMPNKKRSKHAEDDNSNEEDSGSVSDDGHSRSSAVKAVKRKEISTPAYGKHVENLKSVIKSCGMSVPRSIYKRVKQVAENKREAQLIKKLEQILFKGLSANPSEKEIKEVRKRKERAKELEGIDTSNIVLRSTASFVAPSKSKIPDMSDGDESEEGDEDDDEDNDEEEAGDEGNSQSEESDEEYDNGDSE